MRISVAVIMLIVGCSSSALAQSGSGGGGSSSTTSPSSGPRVPSAAPPGNSTPSPLLAPSTGASTPSQRNLDIAPPTRNLPDSQGNAVTPQPPQKGAGPGTTPPQDNQVPPPSGGNARFQPGGANSSQAGPNRTGKNALSESYTSCLNIWDAGTHMSKSEWARACKRVENRLDMLQREAVDANKRLPQRRLSERNRPSQL
jgi:hypothetical protein